MHIQTEDPSRYFNGNGGEPEEQKERDIVG